MKAVLAIFLFLPAMASATTTYLCVADKATGFKFDKASGAWNPVMFDVSSKYLVSQATEKEQLAYSSRWLVKEVGQSAASYFCANGFSEYNNLLCSGVGEFKFSLQNNRFVRSEMLGYWNDVPGVRNPFGQMEGDKTPLIEIGKCSPIN